MGVEGHSQGLLSCYNLRVTELVCLRCGSDSKGDGPVPLHCGSRGFTNSSSACPDQGPQSQTPYD